MSSLSPVGLRCEYLTDPLGIDVARPRLSWTLAATGRGQRQSAYQVLVAGSHEAIEAGQGDLWDTGQVADQGEGQSATLSVVYGGPALGSTQRAWWAVRLWDRDGNSSDLSPAAFWEMGLLAPEDWRAEWISSAETERREDGKTESNEKVRGIRAWEELDLQPSPYLRKAFELRGKVRRARLYATARGHYELRLNGERVGDGLLTPGWSDYRKRIRYQAYDVADLLREGQNALGAILGTGWYSGYLGWYGETEHYGPSPQLLTQLTIEYADGTTATIASDGSWRTTLGPILASDMLMGEIYDARRELPGWDQPGYDDGAWSPVQTEARDDVPLVADRAEPIRLLEELTPVSITPHPNGTTIVDMGQNMVGWVRLSAKGPASTEIRLRFVEMLNPDGSAYTENLRSAHQTDTFVLRGDEGQGTRDETFEPHFTFHGFRYVEVTGYPGELRPEAIVGRVIGSATPRAGEFACSNELVNAIQHAIVWGQRGNFVSIPTDCPQRDERLGWLADAQIFARTATYNADVAAFFTRWLEDVADAQSPEGAFSDVAPRLVADLDGAPAWGDGGVVMPWTVYQVYGDTRIIEERLDGAIAWVEYLHKNNQNLLWRNRRGNDYGDWLSIRAETSKELLATAYFAYSTDLVSRMAAVVGREAEATRYRELFERIKAAFNAAYVGPDGRILGDTQTSYVLALRMNLLPEELREVAARYLVEDIERRGWLLSTGFVGVGYLTPTLTAAGYPDVAYRLLLQENFPSWGYMIRHGATTIWERWDGWTEERGFQTPEMNSFNHYSLGSVGEWLYRSVAGIDLDPEQPGYAHIVVKPQPGGDLTWARGRYQSGRGEIASAWERQNGSFTLRLTVPAGSTATVSVPTSDPASVREGSVPAASAEGVTHLRDEARAAVFAVEAGEYVFEAES